MLECLAPEVAESMKTVIAGRYELARRRTQHLQARNELANEAGVLRDPVLFLKSKLVTFRTLYAIVGASGEETGAPYPY